MLTRYWNSASARERLMLAVMVLFVCGALLFAVLVRPAWRLVRDAPATLQTLDAKVLAMRAQAAQLRAAPAALPTVATQPVSAERELSGPGATVSEARDSSGATTVTLKNVDGAKLGAWLARPDVQKQLQRVSVTRDATSGRISGSMVLSLTN
jgi:type II secretory pathway component PulM